MANNVADYIHETSTGMKTLIKEFLNKRYYQVLRAINWRVVNEDYTIAVTSAAQDYELASDFGQEVSCIDSTNGKELSKMDYGELFQRYPNDVSTVGTVERYAIFRNDSGVLKVRFHYYPSASITVAMPYIVKPAEMGNDDSPVIPIANLLEIGSQADCYRYKRQFAKAQTYRITCVEKFSSTLISIIINYQNNKNNLF